MHACVHKPLQKPRIADSDSDENGIDFASGVQGARKKVIYLYTVYAPINSCLLLLCMIFFICTIQILFHAQMVLKTCKQLKKKGTTRKPKVYIHVCVHLLSCVGMYLLN